MNKNVKMSETYDAIIIGAGITGIYQLHRLLEQGLSVRVFEAGGGVGGAWYWNCYPGARFDSESYTYAYQFSDELLQEWSWSEHFASQPETERYLNYVVDKFGLRPHIELNTTIVSAIYNEDNCTWEVASDDGRRASARFLLAAVGLVSAHYVPQIPGIETFSGRTFHTARWPREPIDFAGSRVGIIGTGSTGVQLTQELAKVASHLTVFQRTAAYACPLNNTSIDEDEQKTLKAGYPVMFEQVRNSFAGFVHDFDPRAALEVSPEERQAHFEKIWSQRGFGKWIGNFHDTFSNREANELYAEFIRGKIRERVKDSSVAEKLTPRGYAFGARRVPLETDFYEAFNQDNVLLVSLADTPIERITPGGIRTTEAEHKLDYLIFATGFDAATGGMTRINITGENGRSLKAEWAEGVHSYLGMLAEGFPNLFIETATVFSNIPRGVEVVVEWVSACIRHMTEHGLKRIVPTREAEQKWKEHSDEQVKDSLLLGPHSAWYIGTNIPGKKNEVLLYGGGLPNYRKLCDEVAKNGYEGFLLS